MSKDKLYIRELMKVKVGAFLYALKHGKLSL